MSETKPDDKFKAIKNMGDHLAIPRRQANELARSISVRENRCWSIAGTGSSIYGLSGIYSLGLLAMVWFNNVQAETTISLLTGQAWTYSNDVRLQQPGGTDLTFSDVSWDTKPFEMPPYYAIRVTRWLDRSPDWGLAIDFNHAKMYSDPEQLVQVSGQQSGAEMNGLVRLGDTFSELEFTDGHNLLTINALRRWRLSERLHPYLGGGLGVAIPHVEVGTVEGLTYEYQLAGPAAQLIAGINFPLGERFSFITEYRFSWADLDAKLDSGGSLSTEALSHHLNFGIGFSF